MPRHVASLAATLVEAVCQRRVPGPTDAGAGRGTPGAYRTATGGRVRPPRRRAWARAGTVRERTRSRWRHGISLAVVAAACAGDAQPLSELAPVPPFDGMSDISIGMRAGELLRASPNLELADYVGYREDAEGYRVWYEIPGSMSEGQAPSPGRRLDAVRVELIPPEDSSASDVWTTRLADVTSRLGPPGSCVVTSDRRLRSRAAVWDLTDAAVLSLALFEPVSDADTPSVALRVGSLHPFLERAGEDGAVPCRTIDPAAR